MLGQCPWPAPPFLLSECYLVVRTLFALPFRFTSLPPLYLRLGVPDPYQDRRLLPLSALENPIMCHSGFNSSSRSEEEPSSSGQDPSSSGSPEPALSPPSLTPSDRNSEGVVPEREDREGQRFYVLTESSGSGGDESISGTPDPVFTSQGTLSSLFVSDLDRIRKRYDFPMGFSLAVPSEEAHIYRPGFVTLYEDAFIAGLRIPLHPLARDLLIFLGIAPGQLAPNGWRFLIGAIYLWPQRFGYELTLPELLWIYRPFPLFGEVGFFSLSARQGKKVISRCPSNNKGWKKKFFHVSTLGFCEENPAGHPLPTVWASELNGKAFSSLLGTFIDSFGFDPFSPFFLFPRSWLC